MLAIIVMKLPSQGGCAIGVSSIQNSDDAKPKGSGANVVVVVVVVEEELVVVGGVVVVGTVSVASDVSVVVSGSVRVPN